MAKVPRAVWCVLLCVLQVPQNRSVIKFPEQKTGLNRQKRAWGAPPIQVTENDYGPFPRILIQVKSDKDKLFKIFYSITGPGANSHTENLFVMEAASGLLQVTRALDREVESEYILQCHAVNESGQPVENPMDLIISVADQNDNPPVFTQKMFRGSVTEGALPGTAVMNVTATDADDPQNTNSLIAYFILKQEPEDPFPNLFIMNNHTGTISVMRIGIDRERMAQYTLTVEAVDIDGKGLHTTVQVVIDIMDANDNPPVFVSNTHNAVVPENEVGFEVRKLSVNDQDLPGTSAWQAVYKIKGDLDGYFTITTDPDTNDGILTTAKGLDYEKRRQHILLITVENTEPFVLDVPTFTATVTIYVEDINEAPFFSDTVIHFDVPEDLLPRQQIGLLSAQDPDKHQNQKLSFSIGNDPANWLSIDVDNGIIIGNGMLDRESPYVKNDTYVATVLVSDDGVPSKTGSSILVLHVQDVNDNSPFPNPRTFRICNRNPHPQMLTISDADLPPNTYPYKVELTHGSESSWVAAFDDKGNNLTLKPAGQLDVGHYSIYVNLADAKNRQQLAMVNATVCNCEGIVNSCIEKKKVLNLLTIIFAIVATFVALLIFLLILLKKKEVVHEPEPLRRYYSNDYIDVYEEGGGEADKDYDPELLQRGLDVQPEFIKTNEEPSQIPSSQDKTQQENPEERRNETDEKLCAADNDPMAAPFDTLLVYNYEGSGSVASSLSTLTSYNPDGDLDFDNLNDWGPRFEKLADMFRGEED